jgi:prepilin-type N-terminal cleavage/methylation domain-containing protein
MRMRARRPGFTLVELLVVAVLGTVVIGAAVQSLLAQERAHRTTAEIIRGQDALRAALGILESELRDLTTLAGPDAGLADLVFATRDSLEIRAQRKVAFVCSVHASDRRIFTWTLGGTDLFVGGDGVHIFADDEPTSANDDVWLPGRVHQVQSSSSDCPSRPAPNKVAHQRVDIAGIDGTDVGGGYLVTVRPGAPVRSFERVTYGLYSFDGEWGLGRRSSVEDNLIRPLVLGLAGPGAGIVFTYLDINGDLITADPVPTDQVAGVRITARTEPRQHSGAKTVELSTHVSFRNN